MRRGFYLKIKIFDRRKSSCNLTVFLLLLLTGEIKPGLLFLLMLLLLLSGRVCWGANGRVMGSKSLLIRFI